MVLARANSFDKRVSRHLHRVQLGPLDYVMLVPGLICSEFVLPATIVLLGVFAESWMIGALATLSAVLTFAITAPMKRCTARERPPLVDGTSPRSLNLRATQSDLAFPSGDSAQAGSLAVFIAAAGLAPVWVCGVFVVSVMVARVYFGAHWIGDTIVGALIGLCVGCSVCGVLIGYVWTHVG